jgi:hypothetical protein
VDGSPDSHGNAEFRLYLPADLESGAYANFLAVWHTVHEFTLDFCSRQPPRQEESEEADAAVVGSAAWSLALRFLLRSSSTFFRHSTAA